MHDYCIVYIIDTNKYGRTWNANALRGISELFPCLL
jgi:hypothetical protein